MNRLPMDAQAMREKHGVGPDVARCGDCAHLRPTVTAKRPDKMARALPLTTFYCNRLLPAARAPWSVEYRACGLFRSAS